MVGEKGRILVKGISLNTLHIIKPYQVSAIKKKSEFLNEAMGNGHKKILMEFLDDRKLKSSFDLEIKKNLHCLAVIHSIYNSVGKNKSSVINQKQSILGK